MSDKTFKILLGLFFFLFFLLGIKIFGPKLFLPTSFYQEKIKPLDKNAVQTIVLEEKNTRLEIKKEKDAWRLAGRKADKEKVEELLTALFPSVPPEIVAQTEKRHRDFGLTEDLAFKISLEGKLTWLLGKRSGSGTYVRFVKAPEVYLLKGSLLGNLSSEKNFWWEKKILVFDKEKAQKLVFWEKGKKTILVKKEGKWQEEEGKEVKKEKIDSLLSSLSYFLADSLFEEEKEKNRFFSPKITLEIEFEGGKETLDFSSEGPDYLVRRLSDGEKFLVSQSRLSSILEEIQELF